MENCHNKITREECLNLIALRISQFEVLVEALAGADFTIPVVGDTITDRFTTNEASITTNQGNISTNTSNISTNTTNIATNTANIATNVTNIATNAADIATLQSQDGRTVTSSDTSVDVDAATSTEYDITISMLAANTDVANSEPALVLAAAKTGSGEHTYTLKTRNMPDQAMSAFAGGVSAGTVTPAVRKTTAGPFRLLGDFALTNFVINWDLSANDGQESDWMNVATLPATYNPSGEGSAVSIYPSTTIYAPIVIFATETSSLTEAVNLIGIARVTNLGAIDIKVATPYRFVVSGTAIEEGHVLASGTDWTGQYTGTLYLQSVTWDWE